jgi:hypothetical protein
VEGFNSVVKGLNTGRDLVRTELQFMNTESIHYLQKRFNKSVENFRLKDGHDNDDYVTCLNKSNLCTIHILYTILS